MTARSVLGAVARSFPFKAAKGTWWLFAITVKRFPLYRYLHRSQRRSAIFFSITGAITVILVYCWYITSGMMTVWTPFSAYFDKLANAFYSGQLALLEKPPAELLALKNPYDYRNRAGIAYAWDASLYQGRYYYYWGPVPALVAFGVKAVLGPETVVEDQYLLLAFASGLNLLIALLLMRLRSVFFPDAPTWSLLPFVLLAGLAMPVLWLINRPSVYEVAIAGGQFFLFLGMYAALQYATRVAPSKVWLLAAGLAWGAAVNCRLNLAVAVGFFTLLIAWKVVKTGKSSQVSFSHLVWLAVPLILWAGGMAWYNFARFGSILETGHRYQLTGDTLTSHYSDTFSARYVLPSLYSYLIRPLQFNKARFPFVFSPSIKENMWPWWIHLPDHYYYPEPVAGILVAIPAIWAAFLPLLEWIRAAWLWLHEIRSGISWDTPRTWLWVWLAGGAVCLFVPLLAFVSASMRYLADAVPLLVILAALGFWKGLEFSQNRPLLRGLLYPTMLSLIAISIGMSLLVNITGDKRFVANNPQLFYMLARFFHAAIL